LLIFPFQIQAGLQYATYFGANANEQTCSIARDAAGNVYIAGITQSETLPYTYVHGFNTTNSGVNTNLYIARFDPTLNTLLSCCIIGGSDGSENIMAGIEIHSNGNVYIAGSSESTNYPTTTSAYSQTHTTGFDIVVSVLSADLSTLLYSTYVGGDRTDHALGLAVDANGRACLTGETGDTDVASNSFPTTLNAYDTTWPTGWAAGQHDRTVPIVLVVDPSLSGAASLAYSSYLGNRGVGQNGNGITVNVSGHLFVTGQTTNNGFGGCDFPVTAGAYDVTWADTKAFISVINPAGGGASDLLYSTYLGGAGSNNYSLDIALDPSGNICVLGQTYSTIFPTTPGAFDVSHNGLSDMYLSILSPTLSALQYSTYIGGSNDDFPSPTTDNSLTVDTAGRLQVAGITNSTDFPVTPGAEQGTLAGGYDVVTLLLDPAGTGASDLVHSTYLGGTANDRGHSLSLTDDGRWYVSGLTASTDFPATTGAYQTTNQGNSDALIFVLGQADWGDVLDPPFPTLRANNGASHIITAHFCLGDTVDGEIDGLQSFQVNGDDLDNTDDEDGIFFLTPFTPNTTMTVLVKVTDTTPLNGVLNAWIDLDGSWSWTSTSEHVITDAPVNNGNNLFNIALPSILWEGTLARFRLSTITGLTYTGQAPDGEVEDNIIPIDSDGDGIPDYLECGYQLMPGPMVPPCFNDRDSDGVPNDIDYDPSGYFYDEADGRIITGGSIAVTGPGTIIILNDGSSGYYQWVTDGTAGIYTLTVTLPPNYAWSSTCLAGLTPLDPTGQPNPFDLSGGISEDATNPGYLTSNACTPFYLQFDLQPGDPIIIGNNLALQYQPPIAVTLASFSAAEHNGTVTLNWTTESEINNAGFNIFRSEKENTGFEKINSALIPGTGNATTGRSYQYIDRPADSKTYYYKLQSVSLNGNVNMHGAVEVTVTTSVGDAGHIPDKFDLGRNYPNPFNPSTRIEYAVPRTTFVSINVYDIHGKLVRALVNEQKAAGTFSVIWDRTDHNGDIVPSGIYFYRMRAANFEKTFKMTLLK
ncbi:T9SS type A sorting domain-containing protein, partial [candidate division KSB1 bacterium]|nr:T9SS type A sorting domain-containing protein [candidate division KSB1 bacterium]